MADADQVSNYCSQTFIMLDKWLNQIGRQHAGQALQIARSALQNNIAANITYYESLALEAERVGETEMAVRNKLLVSMYKSLLEK